MLRMLHTNSQQLGIGPELCCMHCSSKFILFPHVTPTMALNSLPPPSSFLETSFRRLLASCQDIVAGDSKGREDLKSWKNSPVFHHVRFEGLR